MAQEPSSMAARLSTHLRMLTLKPPSNRRGPGLQRDRLRRGRAVQGMAAPTSLLKNLTCNSSMGGGRR